MIRNVIIVTVILSGVVTLAGIKLYSARNQKLISPVVEITPTTTPTVSPIASPSAVLAMSVSATASATPSATPTKKASQTPTKPPTPTPTPTPVPATSKDVNGFIDRFGGQYGVDPNLIRYIALCESGFNSSATQGKYIGLFQFDATTWKNIRKEMGEETNVDLRYSAEESVQTAAYALSKGRSKLWPNCIP